MDMLTVWWVFLLLFTCSPFKLLVLRTGGIKVMAVPAPIYTCLLGVSHVLYNSGTIPVFGSHLKTRSGNWVLHP